MATAAEDRRRAAQTPDDRTCAASDDDQAARDEGYAAGKDRPTTGRGVSASTGVAPSLSESAPPDLNARPRERRKLLQPQEKGPIAVPADFPSGALRTATAAAESSYLVRRTPRDRSSVWNYLLPLALFGFGTLYVYQNPNLFVRTSADMPLVAKPDLRYYDIARSAGLAPRFTLLEKISNEEGWLLQMDVPGFPSSEINVYALGPAITVRGTHSCPAKSNGHRDPVCIERHVSEEVRFPDDADMETARATLDHGVLKVSVKPFPNYRPRGRAIQIMDAFGEKVQEFGETVNEKIGLHYDSDEDWNLSGLETEEYVRRIVDHYVDSVRRTLRVPVENEQQFERLVRAGTDGLIGQFRRRVLTAQQLRDRIRRAAEDIWEGLRQETRGLGEDVGHKASQAYGSMSTATDVLKEEVYEAPGEASDRSARVKSAGEVEHNAKIAVQGTMESGTEMAEEVVDGVLYKAEHAVPLKEQSGVHAAHPAAEEVERGRDSAREVAHRAGHLAGEAAEELRDTVKEAAHQLKDRASESVESVKDFAREGSSYVRHYADEVAQKAAPRPPRVARHQDAANQQAAFEAKSQPKGIVKSLKEKLWWGSA